MEYRQAPSALSMLVGYVGPVTVDLEIAPSGLVRGTMEVFTGAYWRGPVQGRVREGSRLAVELSPIEGPAPEGLTVVLEVDTATGRGELLFGLGGGSIACTVTLAPR